MRSHLVFALLPLFASCNSTKPATTTLEASTEAAKFETIALEHAVATDLAVTVQQLCSDAAKGGSSKIKILSDSRTNSLLVMAPEKPMEHIKNLVAALDVQVDE